MKKLKIFENFSKEETTKTILDKPFIRKMYNKYYLPSVDFENFDPNYLRNNTSKYATLNYSSFIRFYLYAWLLQYKGDDNWTKYIIRILKDPTDDNYADVCETLGKLGNNNVVLGYFNKQLNLGVKDNKDNNVDTLTKMDDMRGQIFTDNNLREITTIVGDLTKKADESEDNVKYFLKKIWGQYFKIYSPTKGEDKKGVDLWRLNIETGDRERLQVKNISEGVTMNFSDKSITITNSKLDLRNYYWYTDEISYDYLIFYDKFRKKMNIVNAKAIYKIVKSKNKIEITLQDWDPKFRAVREYDLPAKFC